MLGAALCEGFSEGVFVKESSDGVCGVGSVRGCEGVSAEGSAWGWILAEGLRGQKGESAPQRGWGRRNGFEEEKAEFGCVPLDRGAGSWRPGAGFGSPGFSSPKRGQRCSLTAPPRAPQLRVRKRAFLTEPRP